MVHVVEEVKWQLTTFISSKTGQVHIRVFDRAAYGLRRVTTRSPVKEAVRAAVAERKWSK